MAGEGASKDCCLFTHKTPDDTPHPQIHTNFDTHTHSTLYQACPPPPHTHTHPSPHQHTRTLTNKFIQHTHITPPPHPPCPHLQVDGEVNELTVAGHHGLKTVLVSILLCWVNTQQTQQTQQIQTPKEGGGGEVAGTQSAQCRQADATAWTVGLRVEEPCQPHHTHAQYPTPTPCKDQGGHLSPPPPRVPVPPPLTSSPSLRCILMSVPRPRSSFSPSSSATVKAPSAPDAQMYLAGWGRRGGGGGGQ